MNLTILQCIIILPIFILFDFIKFTSKTHYLMVGMVIVNALSIWHDYGRTF